MSAGSGEQWVRGRSLDGSPLEYRLLGSLGKGGMATVYRAWDPRLDRELALKVLDGALSQTRLARFEREGQAVASLSHPNVIRIHDAGIVEGRPCLAYELIPDARPLDQAWATLDLNPRLDLLASVISGLAHAHDKGVIHRDLKPENVLVDAEGRPRVTDFGIAMVAAESTRLTQTGAILGSPYTMAPEQIEGDRSLRGPPTDVWALGVLLYLALTDRWPFEGNGVTEILSRIARGKPPAPRSIRPGVDPALERVCLRALAQDPNARYPNAGALGDALATARADNHPRTRRVVLPIVIAVTLLLAATAVIGLSQRIPSQVPPAVEPPAQDPKPASSAKTPTASPSPTPTSPPTPSPPTFRAELALATSPAASLPRPEGSIVRFATRTDLWASPNNRNEMLRYPRGPDGMPQGPVRVALPGVREQVVRGPGEEVLVLCYTLRKKRGVQVVELVGGKAVPVWRDPELRSKQLKLAVWRDAKGRRALGIASDSRVHIITIGADGAATRLELRRPRARVEDLAYLASTNRVVVCGQTGFLPSIGWYDPDTGAGSLQLTVLALPTCPLESPKGILLVGSRTGHLVRYGHSGAYVFLTDPTRGTMIPPHGGTVRHLIRTDDEALFSVSGKAPAVGELCVWDLQSYALVQRLRFPKPALGVAWDPVLRGAWLSFPDRIELRRRVP